MVARKGNARTVVSPADKGLRAAPSSDFPIIGLGDFAGGLEAFELFFRLVPPDCGMAFVLVPHFDPEHPSVPIEMLQQVTSMPVVEVQDQMKVAPNHVYVIPPDRGMTIFHGALTDITERKQAERLLRIAATAFETQEGVMVTDENKVILRVNQAFTRLTGYSAEEVIGHTPSMLSSGWHGEDYYQTIWESVARNNYWQGEIWNRRKNGEVFPEWLTITAVTGADGHITNFVGSFSDITIQKQAEQALLDARKHLEKQVRKTTAELKHLKNEFEEVNTTLKVLLKHREMDKSEAQNELVREMRQEVAPFLEKLRKSRLELKQIRLLGILEANLQHLVSSYGRTATITSAYQQLTPIEMQVASMVRQGLSTKAIAAILSLSPETISIHRKHIRKKLGLESKAANLRSHLMSLTD